MLKKHIVNLCPDFVFPRQKSLDTDSFIDNGMHHKKIIIGQKRIIFVVSFVLFLGKKIVY